MAVLGPNILARTMSVATRKGSGERAWQYHSRSDTHSKVACWTLLFDLLQHCDVARKFAAEGRMGFGINHVMVGPINKTLDLVVTIVDPGRATGGRAKLSDLVPRYGIVLTEVESQLLSALPAVFEDGRDDVSEVAMAIEAKACMTEHSKSLPRLHAEILATGYLARLAVPKCITASYNLVNAAESFISPSNPGKVNSHTQPADARLVVDMVAKAVPLARQTKEFGYDAVGITVVHCMNDGTPVTVSTGSAAPRNDELVHYERMMVTLCSEFRSRFGR